jgi:Tfp pilus assembly protein PilO
LQYGLIAEEVAQVYPDLVAYGKDGRVETVQYQKLDVLVLNELQKQQRTIQDQAAQLKGQADRIAELESLVRRFQRTHAPARQ